MMRSDEIETIQSIKDKTRYYIEQCSPESNIRYTDYFNHTFIPDMVIDWNKQERYLYIRTTSDINWIFEDAKLLDIFHPIILTIEDFSEITDKSTLELQSKTINSLISNTMTLGMLAKQNREQTIYKIVNYPIPQYGRGLFTKPLATKTAQDFIDGTNAAESLNGNQVAQSLQTMHQVMSNDGRNQIDSFYQALWCGHGGAITDYPSPALLEKEINDEGWDYPSSLPERISYIKDEDAFRNLLFEELQLMEKAFEVFLTKEAASLDYIRKSCNLFRVLRDADTEEDPRDTSNYILSFNYAVPQPDKIDSSLSDFRIACWRNVHGRLGKDHIIFGIDMNQLPNQQKSNPAVLQFTKTYRVLRQSGDTSVKEESVGLLEPYRIGENFNTIKVYGHSLGQADYSYFKAIFDRIDLYGSNTKLLFYFPSDHPYIKDGLYQQITGLLTAYGESMPDRSRGDNLMHKMLLEGRLALSELIVPDLES